MVKKTDYFAFCNRCKRQHTALAVAHCKHPAVNKHFGEHICMYCCMKCKFHVKVTNPCGITCSYGK